MNKKSRLILVDGSAYIFRAYYGLPPMNRPDGTPINAVFGFTNMLVKLIEDYNTNWNMEERVEILQKIDSIAAKEYHWAFGWGAPYGYRCLNWDKFGVPENGVGYSGGWLSPISMWWIDPDKKDKLNQVLNNEKLTLPITEEVIDYWNNLTE